MSHYTVAVIHKPSISIEHLLHPYSENLDVEPYVDMTIQDCVAAVQRRIEYFEKTLQKRSEELEAAEKDGSMKETLAELQAKIEDIESEIKRLSALDEQGCFEEEAEDYADYLVGDGVLYSTYNPNSKWDWYEVGGRWSGMLRLKDGTYSNEAKIADIDFTLNQEKYNEAKRWWEVVVDGEEPLNDDEREWNTFYSVEYLRQRYENKDKYATSKATLWTYAVLTPDGNWHEAGKMGWFGISDAETDDEKAWEDECRRLLSEIDPEYVLTIVDCHI